MRKGEWNIGEKAGVVNKRFEMILRRKQPIKCSHRYNA